MDPSRPSIEALAAKHLPFTIPWFVTASALRPGKTFHSSRATSENPWSAQSPFESLDNIPLLYQNDDGGQATYKSTSTVFTSNSADHMTCSFGVGIGCSFLSASVVGQYEKALYQNNDTTKASIRATYRSGAIMLDGSPNLNATASTLLHTSESEFLSTYGDYYLAGYRLGGETGVCLSTSEDSSKTIERLSATITVTVLFVSKSKMVEKFFTDASSGSTICILGYDTLTSYHSEGYADDGMGKEIMADSAGNLVGCARDLCTRVGKRMELLGLEPGQTLGMDDCDHVAKSGLLVELILRPMKNLRSYIIALYDGCTPVGKEEMQKDASSCI